MNKFQYLALNVVFMLIAYLIVAWLRDGTNHKEDNLIIKTGIAAYCMMVVFNTYLTSLPIVRYDWNKVLGIKMISWPIEDLAYLVVALYVGIALYNSFLRYFTLHESNESDEISPPAGSKTKSDRQSARLRSSHTRNSRR